MNTTRFTKGLAFLLGVLYLLSLGWLNYGNYRGAVEEGLQGAPLFRMMLLNSLILSIPLLLMYFSIGLLVIAAHQRRMEGQISPRLAKFIYRMPRIAGVLIIFFLTLFSLDVFSEGGNIWEMLGGFVIHSLPSIIMAAFLAVAWRREWIGFIGFMAAAIFFLSLTLRDPFDPIGILLLFSAPMAAISLLFWVNWKWRSDLSPPADQATDTAISRS